MKNKGTGQTPSIKKTFNRRAKRRSRLKSMIIYAALFFSISQLSDINGYQRQWLKDKFIDAGPRDELTVDQRVELGRHVPPGFNNDVLKKYPDFGYRQRTNVPPGDGRFPRIQEALIDAMPANDNADLQKLQDLSLADAEKYANRLIADESFMQSFKQMDKLEQLELGAAILFALRNNGTTEAEQHFQAWFIQNYEPPESYKSWLDGHIDKLSTELAQDKDLMDNLARWVPRYTYHDTEEAEEQFKLRHAALQKIADAVLAEFGYDSVPVFLSVNGRDLAPDADQEKMKHTLGMFSFTMYMTGGEFILVNYFDPTVEFMTGSSLSDPKAALATILEEAKHATDVFTVRDVFAGKIGRDDPRYAHALALYVNHSGEYSDVKYVKLPLLGKVQTGFSGYEDQYVERTAKRFAKKTNEAIEQHKTHPKKPVKKPAPKPMS